MFFFWLLNYWKDGSPFYIYGGGGGGSLWENEACIVGKFAEGLENVGIRVSSRQSVRIARGYDKYGIVEDVEDRV